MTSSRAATPRLDRVEIAAVAGDDAVELGQRLDLVDDDAAHLRGAIGGLLRQLEGAAAQFVAGGFELAVHLQARRFQLALHLGRHLPHALHRFGKALVGVAEHGVGVAGGLVVDRTHRFDGAAAFVVGLFAHALVLVADRAVAFGGRLRHHAGDLARAGGRRLERLVEQAGEALETLVEILGAGVERGDQLIERDAALAEAILGALIAAFDLLGGAGEFAAVGIELSWRSG